MVTAPPPWAAHFMLNHPVSERILPDVLLEPTLAQLEAISPCPVDTWQEEEAYPDLAMASSFQPLLLQAKHSQLPLLLLVGDLCLRAFTSFAAIWLLPGLCVV